jgi:hypothetical protein
MPLIPTRPNRPRERRRERPAAWLDDTTLIILAAAVLIIYLVLAASHVASAAAARLPAPRQASPVDHARVESVPAFAWKPVRRAAHYEFQLSADAAFKSIVQTSGPAQTGNSYATVEKAQADGAYFWRVRAISAKNRVGRWSSVRSIVKRWTARPRPASPADGATITYPSTALVLRWDSVPDAAKYRVVVATDPSLAHSALGDRTPSVETSGTAFALPGALAPGRYYWAVTPLDAEKHSGRQSTVSAFDWAWPTRTSAHVGDLNDKPGVFDPQFSWDPVAGAAQYQVEVNASEDFAAGSRVCCDETITGTSLSPLRLLPNNTYYWRVRAIDMDGNAGVWNRGLDPAGQPSFRKGFDDLTPTIPRLRLRDSTADRLPPMGTSGLPTTDAPVVDWDPVPGASSYELRVAPWETPGFCNWTASILGRPTAKTSVTATTAWSPLAQLTLDTPVGNSYPSGAIATDQGWRLWDGASYCVRVRARSDRDARSGEIVSEWTQLRGSNQAAFTYHAATLPPCSPTATPGAAYHAVDAVRRSPGGPAAEMPLFTWDRVPGACGYFVVIARDRQFTKIVDVAYTSNPAYAPRASTQPTTYADETTQYFWVVMPTVRADGTGLPTEPADNSPQSFEKRSAAPQLSTPGDGGEVRSQPAFRWTDTIGAREYRIQVDDDPTFGSPIDDVLTNATGYTSTSTYPADTQLYWRVRANDENRIGLTWSRTASFRRRLPIPAPGANTSGGEAIPVLSWAPVEGAVSYDMHVEQVDGTKRDFTLRSTAFTPVVFYGTGVWRWQVRANFKSGFRIVSGGYSGLVPFARRIATPAGLRVARTGRGALVSWAPAVMARQYRVQFSDSDSFTTLLEQTTTDHTSLAPRMASPLFAKPGALYWRVASVDEGGNPGGWATSTLSKPKKLRLQVRGRARKGHRARVRVRVRNATGLGMARIRITVTGAGVKAKPRRTDRRGSAVFRLRPRKHGALRFWAEARGYTPVSARLRVR